jgi:predicted RNA binding protein YcfA (HicA-like mRNA interferase family)
MSKRKKRLQKLKQNPKNVSFEALRQVLEDYGFALERSSGSHHSFKVEINGVWTLFVVPYSRPVKLMYVKDAIALIEEIEAQKPIESDEDDQSGSE